MTTQGPPSPPATPRGVVDIEQLPFIAAVLSDDGEVVAVNGRWRAFAAANGGDPERTGIGTNYLDVCLLDDDAADFLDLLNDVLDGTESFLTHDYPCHGPDAFRWFRVHGVRTDDGVLVMHQPITREVWLSTTTSLLPTGLLDLDVHGGLVEAGPAWLELVGSPLADELGDGWRRHVHPDDRGTLVRRVRATLAGGRRRAVDVRVRAADGRWTHQRCTVVARTIDGVAVGALVSVVDVTADMEARARLAAQLGTDDLTGLASRTVLLERLRAAAEAAEREGLAAGVVYLDLDGFRGLNDRHGHLAGDEVLREVGRRLADAQRPGDVAGRFGGDAFVVVVGRVGTARQLEDAAVRYHAALTLEPVVVDDASLRLAVSTGMTMAGPGEDPLAIVTRADDRMFVGRGASREDAEAG